DPRLDPLPRLDRRSRFDTAAPALAGHQGRSRTRRRARGFLRPLRDQRGIRRCRSGQFQGPRRRRGQGQRQRWRRGARPPDRQELAEKEEELKKKEEELSKNEEEKSKEKEKENKEKELVEKEEQVLLILEDNFDQFGKVEFNKEHKNYTIIPTDPSLVSEINLIATGVFPSDWDYMVESFVELSNSLTNQLGSEYSVSLTNPVNHENILILARNGVLIYDVQNDL